MRRDILRRYVVALIAVFVAVLFRAALFPFVGARLTYLTLLPAVIAAGLFAGLGPGLLATALTAAASAYWIAHATPPVVPGSFDLVGLAFYIPTAVLTVYLCHLVHQARTVAEHAGRSGKETLEGMTDGFTLIDKDWRFVYVNPAAEAMIHRTRDELVGKVLWEINPALAGTGVEAHYRRAANERVTVEFENYSETLARWFHIRIYPTADGGLATLFKDITERKEFEERGRQAVEALRQSEERFRTAVTNAPIPVIMHAEDGEILLVSEEFTNLTGYAKEDLPSFSVWLERAYGADAGRVATAIAERFANHEGIRHGEFPVTTVTGTTRLWSFTVAPPGTLHDGRRYLVAMATDITDRRRVEEEKSALLQSERTARSAAERTNRMKDEFLATLSHELRTPLHAMLGWAQIMRRVGTEDPEALAKGLEIIERNTRVQTRLIEDLLDMSRIVSGKLRIDLQSLDPASIVEAAAETVRPAAELKGVRIERILDPLAGPVAGDAGRLQQVVWNLLSNAIKFTPPGGIVQVVLQRAASHVEIVVTDTGEGIRPEFLPHVFERFRQADASSSRKHSGLGVGLAIVKHLVEMHGGSVEVASDGEGRGSTFTVRLPVMALRGAADGGEPAGGAALLPTRTPTLLAGVKVLVVDNEPDARDLIRRVLEECEAEVALAESANHALTLIDSWHPDVLISDIGMPDKDGYQFIHEVRSRPNEAGKKLPAVALTAFARSEDRTRAMLAGYQVHIAKPVESNELIATVASLAGRTGVETLVGTSKADPPQLA